MSATGTPTPNLGLRIPLGTDPASVDDINYNSNSLDTIIGDIGETSVAGQLSATNNRISAVQAGLAIVCNGNTHAAIESGQFAYVKNHGTLAEGLYRNNTGSTIAANATLSSSNLTADSSGGLNTVYDALNSKLTTVKDDMCRAVTLKVASQHDVLQNTVFELAVLVTDYDASKIRRIIGLQYSTPFLVLTTIQNVTGNVVYLYLYGVGGEVHLTANQEITAFAICGT